VENFIFGIFEKVCCLTAHKVLACKYKLAVVGQYMMLNVIHPLVRRLLYCASVGQSAVTSHLAA